jgi:hypothetical protein
MAIAAGFVQSRVFESLAIIGPFFDLVSSWLNLSFRASFSRGWSRPRQDQAREAIERPPQQCVWDERQHRCGKKQLHRIDELNRDDLIDGVEADRDQKGRPCPAPTLVEQLGAAL